MDTVVFSTNSGKPFSVGSLSGGITLFGPWYRGSTDPSPLFITYVWSSHSLSLIFPFSHFLIDTSIPIPSPYHRHSRVLLGSNRSTLLEASAPPAGDNQSKSSEGAASPLAFASWREQDTGAVRRGRPIIFPCKVRHTKLCFDPSSTV